MSIRIGKQQSLRRLKKTGIIVAAIAIAIICAGIGSRMFDESSLARKTDAEAIPTVSVIMPKRGTKDQTLVLPGDIQAYFEAPIYARVSGYLKDWEQDIGARVKAGQLLAEIDTPDLDQQLNQAKADLAVAQSNEALAELTSKRWQVLVRKDAVSQQDADEKSGDAQAKKAAVVAAEANVQRLRALEAFKRIVAPFDGIVTARETDIGALINAGGGAGPELFKIADIHKMRIYVRVPQTLSGDLVPGQIAELQLPQHPGLNLKAMVVTSAHAINPTSRTLLVELQIDNPNGDLQPGAYAEVYFKLPDSPDTLRLPTSALLFREDGLRVAMLGADNKVTLKTITIGRDLGTEVEITSGLTATDKVIDSPSDSIAAGDIVRTAEAQKVAEAQQR